MNTKDTVLVALFCALIIVLGFIPPIPMPGVPVPITLQTFGVMLAGLILGPRRAGFVLLLYVAIALLGIPVLPGGRAGMAVLAGPTGGFLLGMIPGAMLTGWLAGRRQPVHEVHTQARRHARTQQPSRARMSGWSVVRLWFACMVGGVVLVYACGIPWLSAVSGMSLVKAFWVMLVFVPGDIAKALVAAIIAERLRGLNLT